jgi:hypothetical protein
MEIMLLGITKLANLGMTFSLTRSLRQNRTPPTDERPSEKTSVNNHSGACGRIRLTPSHPGSHRELSLPCIMSDIGTTARRRMRKSLKVQVIQYVPAKSSF